MVGLVGQAKEVRDETRVVAVDWVGVRDAFVGEATWAAAAFGLTLPLCPPPVVRETTTVVVQPPARQTLVVPQTVVVQPDPAAQTPAARVPGILPGLATTNAIPAKVWVEGYWRVLRDENGAETSRTWVPGHWEETTR